MKEPPANSPIYPPPNRFFSAFHRRFSHPGCGADLASICSTRSCRSNELISFERALPFDYGTIVAKFWIHISREEQLRRFEERKQIGYKAWKLTDEDWRNREKWDAYEEAVEEMLVKTSTRTAPWSLIEGNDKYWARTKLLATLVEILSNGLSYKPQDPLRRKEPKSAVKPPQEVKDETAKKNKPAVRAEPEAEEPAATAS